MKHLFINTFSMVKNMFVHFSMFEFEVFIDTPLPHNTDTQKATPVESAYKRGRVRVLRSMYIFALCKQQECMQLFCALGRCLLTKFVKMPGVYE